MNMQYAQAVIAHEAPRRQRLAVTPHATDTNPGELARYAAASLPRDLACHCL